MAGFSECPFLKGFVHFWTLTVEPYLKEHHEMNVAVPNVPNIKDYARVILVSKFNDIKF